MTNLKAILKKAVLGATVLLLGASFASAQNVINLSAGPQTATLPDGSTVPMWGYSCGAPVPGSPNLCFPFTSTSGGAWSPLIIYIDATQNATGGLTINLTNNLVFGANKIPTSLMMVGQVGGGLGGVTSSCNSTSTSTTGSTCVASPDHSNAQGATTWPIPGGPGATAPPQGPRVQSFGTEVEGGTTVRLNWPTLNPGTYLLESGTHPSIQVPMGLIGMVVVTVSPTYDSTFKETAPGCAYPTATFTACAVSYDAETPELLSEIDPVQNRAVSAAVNTTGFSENNVWSGQPNQCGNPASSNYLTCYPPAVNYTPLYYLINGTAFNKTNPAGSNFPVLPPTIAPAAGTTGNILVRFVNAGLKMHVPSIVGSLTGPSTNPTGGFSLVAEDGNLLPGLPRVQSEVFMAPGKTYDVTINAPAAGGNALPVYDRELSLSGNATARDAGMLAYISVNGAGLPAAPGFGAAVARADTYSSLAPGETLAVSDPSKGVIANDTNVYGVQLVGTVAGLTLNADGTFTYIGPPTTFTYCANGTVTAGVCSSGKTALVTLGAATADTAGAISCTGPISFTSNSANYIAVQTPGLLATCKDSNGYPLTVDPTSLSSTQVIAEKNGGFIATTVSPTATAASSLTFSFKAKSSYGTLSAAMNATVNFSAGSGLTVKVVDGNDKTTPITDYRWIIEEDRTFYIDPNCTTNPPPAGCPTAGGIVPTFGTNFHTSYMPVVAIGCTGTLSCESGQKLLGQNAVCDVGNGVCRTTATQVTTVLPSQVHLDPKKRYYISVLPGDAANPFNTANAVKGHGMGGAPVPYACPPTSSTCSATPTFPAVTVLTQPTPLPAAKLSVFVFEDDFPLNGENDAGGQVADNQLGTEEPGLGGFNITLFDDAGGTGDATGQMTYDMFNMPLANSLDGTIDPATGKNACPITAKADGITSTIVTCPKYESDGITQSPLAGQAVVANMMPGRYGVVATPAADRIAKGEEWLQTNTLDGQKAHDSFLRVGEPSFFQEYGPASYHVTIGFANPAIINGRRLGTKDPVTGVYSGGICNTGDPNTALQGVNCTNTIIGTVTTERMSRTPDERLYSSGSNDSFSFTQCYVSFGDPDGEDFAFTKCAADGSFKLTNLPDGDWRVTVFDQWNDMLVDGLSTPVRLAGGATTDLGQLATNQWQANIYTSTFFDTNGNGVRDSNETGLTLVPTNIRFRDGSYSNFNNTDLSGNAGFNEEFPLFSWYVVESDSTRYKNTGTHVVYDAGGPADGTPGGGTSQIAQYFANTLETVPVPTSLRVPGAYYCANADCTDAPQPLAPGGPGGTTGRVDPPWVTTEGWQGFSGQNSFLEFGKKPYAAATATTPAENGGIRGEVIYASTRPFDDPALLIHTSWTPDVPGVTINLYQEGTAPDGNTSLKLVDTTKTSSFDDWAQGFRSDGNPNMNCPGQGTATGTNADLFFFSLYNQPDWLDTYNNGGTPAHTIPNNSQFKCYDGMHNWNQLQPAPFDGEYHFPSVTAMNPTTGKPTGTNCTICIANPDSTDPFRVGTPMLPAGKYVVEVVVPQGYELVKEEDKNILIGDNFIAPVTQQFAGLSNIFILPDQAQVSSAYNANNPQNPTQALGRTTLPSTEADTGSVEQLWPCVGEMRVVPDFISLFPQSGEVAPFAGATRPLCDRKEVNLVDQTSALAKFWVFTSTHAAAHFTGVITDDFTSEFDPFSPQFGEKFAPPDMPISIKDWAGNEISRIYADHWGAYDGLTYSTWEVNPPNPTGYAPTMMITCMNDPGTGATPDALYNPEYSNFCYEIPFMPGQTQYMDTPVTPTSAFAGAGYNNPDCAYPALTPAIAEVDGDGVGPYVSAALLHSLTITALGDQFVPNNAYVGPSATAPPYNQKTVLRHYGFGTCTPALGVCTNGASVTIGGVKAPVTSWSDTSITVGLPLGVPNCAVQQQVQYGGSTAQCGELVVTTSTGQQSIDTVTVTIGGKAPTHVAASDSIQTAINNAKPGDLLMIDPTCTSTAGPVACTTAGATHSDSVHSELLLMWKPVRLQGVGAASSIIDGNTHPAGKLDTWRANVNCLFGLGLSGTPSTWSSGCGSGWFGFTANATNPQVDRLPLEAVVGWDATLNGNLAQLLQEPTLMGALEGAAITVLAKGVNFPSNPFVSDIFPVGTTLLTGTVTNGTYSTGDSNSKCHTSSGTSTAAQANPFPSNFQCNPSSIDGLGIRNSSQGGGGIFVHAWGHNLQIANNRVNNNSGTLSGGINIGQGEFPPAYLGGAAAINADPNSCQTSSVANLQLPYCHNLNVNVHHNAVTSNSSTGDELFSATPAGAGGVSFCTGSDYYKFQYNWVCGNLSTGDGGGFGHLGFSYNGDIEHNTFLFNQATNPTIPTNGGGLIIMGAPDADPVCGTALADIDCVPTGVSPSDGIGPLLTINGNLVMGNAADSGSGGGLALQNVNGSDVVAFPTTSTSTRWNHVVLTNNIIVNNVAGWDGAGISLLDALNTDLINNTIESNDTTASSGVLFNTLGAPLASSQGPTCTSNCGTASAPQPAGLVSIQTSAILTANLPATITCPAGHFQASSGSNSCRSASYPLLDNNVFYQNRSFYIGVGALGGGTLSQQNIVTLYNAFTNNVPPGSQSATGACPTPVSYWDIGVRGDLSPTTHESTVTLNPTYSVLTQTTGYTGTGNTAAAPTVVSQYCNGSRIPPEFGGTGFQVPPGISDATVPNPVFNLTPAATVDEGNNWINLSWGPLALASPVTGATLGNYSPTSGSSVINLIPSTANGTQGAYTLAPTLDFFGNTRKTNLFVDAGAVEFSGPPPAPPTLSSIVPNTGLRGTAVPVTLTGTNLTGTTAVTVTGTGVTVSAIAAVNSTTVTATFTISTTATLSARTVSVTTASGTSTTTVTFTVLGPTLTSIAPTSGVRNTTVPVTLTGTGLTGATAVTPSGTGVTCTITGTPTATAVNASCAITAGATLGARTIGVTTPIGATNTEAFTVQGATLTSIAPTSGVRGTTVPVTLTGTNFPTTGVTTVTASGTGVTASAVTVVNATTITATLTITPGAALTSRTVTVTTPIGATNTVAFQVTGATVTFSGPAPTLSTGATSTHSGFETVSNAAAATGPLTITATPTAAKVTGPASGVFSVIAGGTCVTGFVVNPGNSCTINVQYAPGGSATAATGNVTITGSGLAAATLTSGNFGAN
jgi:hypothetical protein